MNAARAPLTLGTAGHIDHGKTALIGALTGRDTDRLPEERERGISIELGYAPLTLPSGRRLSVVDVPGHERFVRTMVAGASGIDLFLLCIAADDGVMPQTLEHLTVLQGLGVRSGVVAVTKSDIGDPAGAGAQAEGLLPGVPIVQVSARARTGLEELLTKLDEVAAAAAGRAADDGPARLHVDRSFTLKGIGTVVTGTLWSGSIAVGDELAILPQGARVRVRSVQVHDQPHERAAAGQRVAVNLNGVRWQEVSRGDVVASLDAGLRPTYLVNADLSLERPLERGTRVQVHHGTREAPARVVPLGGDRLPARSAAPAQLRLEAPLVPMPGDRLIVRQIAPPDTLGGGVVTDAHPRKNGRPRVPLRAAPAIAKASTDEPADDAAAAMLAALRADGERPRTDAELAAAAGLRATEGVQRLRSLERAGSAVRIGENLHIDARVLAALERRLIAICARDGGATVGGLRDELSTSRKYAQALLEHLDRTKVTRREGDRHVLRRSYRTGDSNP